MTTFAARWRKAALSYRPPTPLNLGLSVLWSGLLLLAGTFGVVQLQEFLPSLVLIAAIAAILAWQMSRVLAIQREAIAVVANRDHPVSAPDSDTEWHDDRLSASTIGFVLKDVDMSLESRQELIVGLVSAISTADLRRLADLAADAGLHSSIRQEIAAALLEQDLPGGLEALASLMSDDNVRGQDRLMAASALLQHGDARAVSGLWTIVRWPGKEEAQSRLDAALLLNEAEQDHVGASAQSFRALEYIANDTSATVQVRMLAADYLLGQGHRNRAVSALWNLVVESAVSGPLRLDLANRLRELAPKRAAAAYRALAYDASLALPIRFRAAEQLRVQSEADGERALRDLSYTAIPST